MLNQVVLVGRIVRDPNIQEASNNEKYSNITIAIPRSYKNINGEYDTDFIDCVDGCGNCVHCCYCNNL